MNVKTVINQAFHYLINEIKANAIGISATIFAISVFLILIFFLKPNFPNFMETHFKTDEQRGDYVIEQLTR